MAEKFKLGPFDVNLLKEVSSGQGDLKKISASFKVDWKDFQNRVNALAKKGLIVIDEADSNTIRLGVEGYNSLHVEGKPKKTAKKAGRPKKAVEKTVEPVQAEKPSEQFVEIVEPVQKRLEAPKTEAKEYIDIPYNPLIHGKDAPEQAAVPLENPPVQMLEAPKTDAIDLVEVFEKYGVKKKTVIKEKLGELSKAIEDKPLSTTLATLAKEGRYESEEKCDLCKAPFRLSLGKDNHPKYGHCFCGAIYHKDCYETLLDNEGKCLRCGKKLVLILDKQSEDAIKAVKKLFE